jgi:hypothetical protein
MRAVEVIVMKIVVEEGSAMVGGVIGPGISPLAGDGLDEAFGLAIGLGPIRSGEEMLETELTAGSSKEFGTISRAAVGEEALDLDAVSRVKADGLLESVEDAGGLFVREETGKGEAGMVVDGGVEGLETGAGIALRAVAGGADAWVLEATELLDVEVEKIAWSSAFVADDGRFGRFQGREAVELMTAQDAGKRGLGNGQDYPDLGVRTAGAAQGEDLGFELRGGLARLPLGSAGTVLQPWIEAFLFGASEPFAHGPLADAKSSGGGAAREVLRSEQSDHFGSHQRRKSGISVHVVRAEC